MIRWLIFLILNLSIIVLLFTGRAIPMLSYVLIAFTLFVMTPVMLKNFIRDEEFPPLLGTLIVNVFAITLSFFILFLIGESEAPLYSAIKWAFSYFVFTGLAYFAIKQIQNS